MRLNKYSHSTRLCCFVYKFFFCSNFWNPDEAEPDNDDEVGSFSAGRDGVLFLIDAGTVANDEEQFRDCLSLIEATMLNRIIQSEKDLVWFFD